MNCIHDLPRRHAITVEEYVRMGEAHVFAQHARLGLMEGEIVEMAPIGSAHAAVVNTLDALLGEIAPRAIVGEKNLRRMVRFAEVFPHAEIVAALLRQLGWSHFWCGRGRTYAEAGCGLAAETGEEGRMSAAVASSKHLQ